MPAERQQFRGVAINTADKHSPTAAEQGPSLRRPLHIGVHVLGSRRSRALVPSEFYRWQLLPGRKAESDDGRKRVDLRVHATRRGLDSGGWPQLQGPIHHIQSVSPAIAHHAAAKIPPAAPCPRMVSAVVRTMRRRTEPEVPIQ